MIQTKFIQRLKMCWKILKTKGYSEDYTSKMSDWSEVFKTSGLKEMVVKDGVTGRVLYYGKKGVSC